MSGWVFSGAAVQRVILVPRNAHVALHHDKSVLLLVPIGAVIVTSYFSLHGWLSNDLANCNIHCVKQNFHWRNMQVMRFDYFWSYWRRFYREWTRGKSCQSLILTLPKFYLYIKPDLTPSFPCIILTLTSPCRERSICWSLKNIFITLICGIILNTFFSQQHRRLSLERQHY